MAIDPLIQVSDFVAPLSKRRLATQNRLIAATRRLLARVGDAGATVEAICEEAGFTRGAFYSNFSSKPDLYAAVAVEEYATLLASLEKARDPEFLEAAAQVTDPKECLQLAVDTLLGVLPVDQDTFVVQSELALQALREPDRSEDYRETNLAFLTGLGEVLERILALIDRKPYPSALDLAHVSIAVVLRSVRAGILSADEVTSPDIAGQATRVMPRILYAMSEPLDEVVL